MSIEILNRKEFHDWAKVRVDERHVLIAIKGPPLKGMVYSDGDPVEKDVTVGWRDTKTKETFMYEYGKVFD